MPLQCSIACALLSGGGFCIFGGLLSPGRNPPARWSDGESRPTTSTGANHDRSPMGKGHAPGITTGLGVSGARGSAAGSAAGASGARVREAAGFFLAAFFLADFSVGFFLAALRVAAFARGAAVRAVLRLCLRPDLRVTCRVSFFLLLSARFCADLVTPFLRIAFLAVGMMAPVCDDR